MLIELSCPLNFYKINENIIPNMAKIAKMVFCITASSVTPECLFSTARSHGLDLTKKIKTSP